MNKETVIELFTEAIDSESTISLLKDQTGAYVPEIKKSNKFNEKLLSDIKVLQEELESERQRNKELNKQLDMYSQTGAANINKRMLNYYVESIKDRQLTDEEWLHFINDFSYDNVDLDKKLYAWIESHLK
jgi:hypothetical protein